MGEGDNKRKEIKRTPLLLCGVRIHTSARPLPVLGIEVLRGRHGCGSMHDSTENNVFSMHVNHPKYLASTGRNHSVHGHRPRVSFMGCTSTPKEPLKSKTMRFVTVSPSNCDKSPHVMVRRTHHDMRRLVNNPHSTGADTFSCARARTPRLRAARGWQGTG